MRDLLSSGCLERKGHSLGFISEHLKELLAKPTSRDCKREILYSNESLKIMAGGSDPRSPVFVFIFKNRSAKHRTVF